MRDCIGSFEYVGHGMDFDTLIQFWLHCAPLPHRFVESIYDIAAIVYWIVDEGVQHCGRARADCRMSFLATLAT